MSTSGNDNNAGTQTDPWRTIGKAASALKAGQTACVMDGTYTEPTIAFKTSGTASQPITLRAQNKWKAIIATTSGCYQSLDILASYITIENMRFTVSPSNVACTTGTTLNYHIQTWNKPYEGVVIRGNKIDDSPQRYGSIKTRQNNSLVENNVLYGEIEGMGGRNIVYRNNIIYQGTHEAILHVKGGARDFQAYNNTIHVRWSTGYGLNLGGASGVQFLDSTGTECYDCVGYNNLVINDNNSDRVSMMGMRGCYNCTLRNNVGIGGAVHLMLGSVKGMSPRAKNHNPKFLNNILIAGPDKTMKSTNLGFDGNWTGTLTVDGNNFYGYTTNLIPQTNAITGQPLFVNGDYRQPAGWANQVGASEEQGVPSSSCPPPGTTPSSTGQSFPGGLGLGNCYK